MIQEYLIGDYVRYEGDMSTLTEPLRSSDLGIIEIFQEFFNKERIYLFLVNKKQHIWCDYDKIRPIETTHQILEDIGFIVEENNERKRYTINQISVSNCALNIIDQNHLILTGYCIADFTNGIENIEKYFIEEKFSMEKFYTDYPFVNNINNLARQFKKMGVEIDITKALIK